MNKKTTIYLDAVDYNRVKRLAREEGRSAAGLIREAVREYANRRLTGSPPRSIGSGHSGRNDLSERTEDLLAGMGRDE